MILYTVKSGDSVFSIARKFSSTPTRIISDNMLVNPSKLSVGEDIVILAPTETYTVRGGDTLTMIADRYGVTLLDLYRNNPVLGGEANINPGMTLNIRYPEPPLGKTVTNGFAYPTIERDNIRRTLPYLTYLSIFSYGIDSSGRLIPPGKGEDELISLAKAYKTVPILVISSINENGKFSSEHAAKILSDPGLTDRIVREVAGLVRAKGYGGVNADFEYIPGEYAEAYGDFLTSLEEELGEDYPVFVSLAPKYSAEQAGVLYEGHSYPLLGAGADYSILMTYEWGYTYGPPMPVSPVNQVRRVLDYAVDEISRDRLFLGVPNYGYDWSLPYERGKTKARSLGNAEAVRLAFERKAEIKYDEQAAAPYYTFYDRPETYADAVEHIVWFENAHTAEALLRLVREYGMHGFSVWNLTRFFPALWLVANSLFEIEKK